MLRRSVLLASVPGIVLAILCLAPFLSKPFTIDDPFYLAEAHQALVTPLTPAAAEICWDNIPYPRPLRQVGTVGLAGGYLLIPVALLHDKEWVGHAIILLLLCIAVIATVSLAVRCGASRNEAMLAGLLFASFPTVLAMAGTLMPDMLAATLVVIGLERLLAWKAEGRSAQAWAAGVALAIAAMARSHTLLVLPVGMLMIAGDRWESSFVATLFEEIRKKSWRQWLPFAIAIVSFAALTAITYDRGGASTSVGGAVFPGGPTAEQFGVPYVLPNALEFGINWLAVTPLAIAWLILDEGAGFLMVAGALMVAGILGYAFPETPGLSEILGLIGWVAIGSVAVWVWRTRNFALAGLGLCLFIALPMIPYKHLPSRYIVPCASAASILLAMRILREGRWPRVLSACLVIAGAAMGLTILRADETFSGLARRAAIETVAPEIRAGHRVWYSGQWALNWYAQQAGASCLTTNKPGPQKGDIVIAGEVEGGTDHIDDFHLNLRPLRVVENSEPGVRIMSQAAQAGFYGNSFGFLPWRWWSTTPVNIYHVWQVE